MRLETYLEQRGMTQAEFAKLMKPPVSQGTISHWIKGRAEIPLGSALQIEAITGGTVTVYDWDKRELPYPPRQSAEVA